jgi:hypothetical protein
MAVLLWQWAQVRYPQGRLLFPALGALASFFAAGLLAWVPQRARAYGAALISAGFLALAVWMPFGVIQPAYQAPPTLALSDPLPLQGVSPVDFQRGIRLVGWEIERDGLQAGQDLAVTLYWESTEPLDRDYSVFLHLVDEESGLIAAQRDSYPGLGNRPTRAWHPGEIIPDPHRIETPPTAPTPCRCQLVVGLYDYRERERLDVLATEASYARLGEVQLLPRRSPEGIPNPLEVVFGDRVALVGFEMDRRTLHPGDTLQVDLYWRSLAPMELDYTIFVHLVRGEGEVWTQKDQQPQGGAAPTSGWQVGQLVTDSYLLELPPEAPTDAYDIEIGLYDPTTFDRLPVDWSDAGVVIGQVRVVNP